MPNLVPPITTKAQISAYKQEILEHSFGNFTPFFAFFLSPSLTKSDFLALKDASLCAKLYPSGVTTNSNGGANLASKELYAQIELLEELEIPLSIHGETNGFVLDREREFAPIYKDLATNFPRLKIIMEHISTKELADLIGKYDNLFATITLHHLILSLDDVLGGMCNVHNFCKPTPKLPSDRQALLDLVFSGDKSVMFGSDSAPHKLQDKLQKGFAGIFSAPVLLPMLCELFAKHGKIDLLQDFISTNAQKIYKLDLPEKLVKIAPKNMKVPQTIGDFVPFGAGKTIGFCVEDS